MKIIKRDKYLKKLIERKGNGLIKIITGIRRSGKSFLLNTIYKNYLIENGVKENQIIMLSLDDSESVKYRNPLELEKYVREMTSDKSKFFYIFIDEIQMAGEVENPYLPRDTITYVTVLLSLMKMQNADIYVTGSNSKLLSSNIVTEFRDKGDEIHMFPLSFGEYSTAQDGDNNKQIQEFMRYGGMPRILQFSNYEDKSEYLKNLLEKTYLKDVVERYRLEDEKSIIDEVLNVIASSEGSLVNADRIANTLASVRKIKISSNRIYKYLEYFKEAYIISEVERYDIKGRKHIGAQKKFYFADPGLRNACLSFRNLEEPHLMESIIFSELIYRGYEVSVGSVEYNWKDEVGKSKRSQLEVDFVAEKADEKFYIQSAYMIPDETKMNQEINSLKRIRDSFRKIVVVRDNIIPWHDENGILFIGLEEFLLNENSLKR